MSDRDCDKCGERLEGGYVTVRHVKIDHGMIQEMKGTMRVHSDCHDDMKESDAYDL